MKAPLRSILIKISLKQPTKAEYIELDKATGTEYERTALLGLSSPTPTYSTLEWGEYWMAEATESVAEVEQVLRQKLAEHADNIRMLSVQVVHDPNFPDDSLTWEQGWEKLRAAHTKPN